MLKKNNNPLFLLPIYVSILFILLFSSGAWADKLFVLENLRLRTEPSLESPVLITVKKGEEVEVLGIQDDFTRIESNTGTKGWVASSFLTDQPPQTPTPSPKVSKLSQANATIAKQKKELQKLKKRLANQDKNIKQLKQKAANNEGKKALSTAAAPIENKPSVSDEQIAQIRKILGENSETKDLTHNSILPPLKLEQLSGLHISIVLGLALLGFILGILWSDFTHRRRHGGYRV